MAGPETKIDLVQSYRVALESERERAGAMEKERDSAILALANERKRADSLAHSCRLWQGEIDMSRVEIAALRNQVAASLLIDVSTHNAARMGAEDERAAVVAWLRGPRSLRIGLAGIADAIERGEHDPSIKSVS